MTRLILFFIILLPATIHSQVDNSFWTHVGPISENLQNGNKFETGKLNDIAINPNNGDEIFTSGTTGGLWHSTDKAETWQNVPTIPIGTNGISAITFNNTDEIIVANYVHFQVSIEVGSALSKTNGVFKFNPSTNVWTPLGQIPLTGRNYIVNTIAVHPTNNDLVFVGTSHGLFRSTNGGTIWLLVSTAEEFIQEVDFYYNPIDANYSIFYTGTDIDLSDSDEIILDGKDGPTGDPILCISGDDGLSFSEITEFRSQFKLDEPDYTKHGTIFCFGEAENFNEVVIYVYGSECENINTNITANYYLIYKVSYDFSNNSAIVDQIKKYSESSVTIDRMGIDFDIMNNRLFYGGTKLRSLNLITNSINNHATLSNLSFSATRVHDDVHDVMICPSDPSVLYAVSDGGFYDNNLSSPNIFNHKNHGIHSAEINGFSGSAQDPDYYLVGLFHIIHTSLYDEKIKSNRYTQFTWENDGGLIDAFNDNIVILDQSSYGSLPSGGPDNYFVSNDNGENINSVLQGAATANFNSMNYFQDPYRERLFRGYKGYGIHQFNLNTLKFDIWKCRIAFSDQWPYAPTDVWDLQLHGMAFHPDDPNSVHVITTTRANVETGGSIAKFTGNDFEAMTIGNFEDNDINGTPAWQDITPDWVNGSNIIVKSNMPYEDLNTFSYTGIAKSNSNKNTVFVTCTAIPKNPGVKVIKYDDQTWTDYSKGIPVDEYPTAIVVDPMSEDGLYTVTERNVYYRDASMNEWMPFGTNYPKLYGNQMEINQLDRTLRVGTFGRGIWKTYLKCPNDIDYYETGIYSTDELIQGRVIKSIAEVPVGVDVNYKANTEIKLLPGFKAICGTKFRAMITPCNPTVSTKSALVGNQATFEEATPETFKELFEDKNTGITIYPNPTEGIINISLEKSESGTIQIYSISGKLLMSSIFSGTDRLEANLKKFESGTYFIKIKTDTNSFTKKIIKE
ncbi:MAG: T9SS type A sorting domain-containing protein [Crocinitomicaceae bacterium]